MTSQTSTPHEHTPPASHPWVIVVAYAQNRAIGMDDGAIPWRLPSDLRRLRQLTLGHAVVMGRKTYETLPKPLGGRTNIVVSRREDWCDPEHPEVLHAESLDDATDCHALCAHAAAPLIILGGGQIYEMALPKVGIIERTLVETEPDADVFFPQIDDNQWSIELDEPHPADEMHSAPYRFQRLRRRV